MKCASLTPALSPRLHTNEGCYSLKYWFYWIALSVIKTSRIWGRCFLNIATWIIRLKRPNGRTNRSPSADKILHEPNPFLGFIGTSGFRSLSMTMFLKRCMQFDTLCQSTLMWILVNNSFWSLLRMYSIWNYSGRSHWVLINLKCDLDHLRTEWLITYTLPS